VGRLVGLPEEAIEAIEAGEEPQLQSEEEEIAYDFTRQLALEHRIDPETYASAAEAFGYKGLVDMVLLIGLYMATCAIINAFEVTDPEPIG
jgi:4-carboxymuconolactone decarboxylase